MSKIKTEDYVLTFYYYNNQCILFSGPKMAISLQKTVCRLNLCRHGCIYTLSENSKPFKANLTTLCDKDNSLNCDTKRSTRTFYGDTIIGDKLSKELSTRKNVNTDMTFLHNKNTCGSKTLVRAKGLALTQFVCRSIHTCAYTRRCYLTVLRKNTSTTGLAPQYFKCHNCDPVLQRRIHNTAAVNSNNRDDSDFSTSDLDIRDQVKVYTDEEISEEDPVVKRLFAGLVDGKRASLAESITLVESLHHKRKAQAQVLLSKVLQFNKEKFGHKLYGVAEGSFRIGG